MAELLEVGLDDKYEKETGRIYLTGIQALVRLPLEQKRRDSARGFNTAGYVTGYRGSPLGAYDQQLEAAKRHLDAHAIRHQPAVNEDLAATACQGTQQVHLQGESAYDGVFAIWYGKGPGVDRSGDAIRHGNLFGTARHGGVLLLLGDDHICESSTTAHQSEYAMVDAMVPILNPSGVQEILELGLHGIAMSRFSGAWVALKCIHDTVESTASIEIARDRPTIREPSDFAMPEGGLSISIPPDVPWQPIAVEVERKLHVEKLEAARAYARANGLDRVVMGGGPADRLCLVTCGKSYQDVVAALEILGIDEARARALGLRVYKPAMTWPLEPTALREALDGIDRVLVIEEKRPLIEDQIKEILYHEAQRPRVEGKKDRDGGALLPSFGQLDVNAIARAIAVRLLEGTRDPALERSLADLEAKLAGVTTQAPGFVRLPWFCPGCPHNSSTRVPEGSRAVAGIGCHFMATWMDRKTVGFTQMGGEGASWLGIEPFIEARHVFQNVGDGTFYHSGSLAVRAAIAAGATMTFKILYNDAVAMTGGQKMETANLTVPQIVRLLDAEGVQAIAVVTDEPDKYPLGAFDKRVRIDHRDDLDAVQRRLREIGGVTALIYDQTCAAEKRRRRKRGTFPDPDRRVIINELVCEGCGDCGVQSNCVAIQPLETEFGRKRRIDQSACNKDFSCLKGFCPSFATVHGGRLKKTVRALGQDGDADLPEPALPPLDQVYGIVVTGIGGTGVITIAALIGMAAHLEGKGFVALDMLGLAQKGGAVVSHLKIARDSAGIGSPRIAAGTASLILGCDLVVAAGRTALPTIRKGSTRVLVNGERTMTGEFTKNRDLDFPAERLKRSLEEAAGAGRVEFVDATRLATRLLGDGIGANLFMVGFAWQRGLVPLSREAIVRAIEINGVAVEFNRRAFAWGRIAAADPVRLGEVIEAPAVADAQADLETLIDRRAAFLEDYQDEAWARRYRDAVLRVREAERAVPLEGHALAHAVARNLFRLMAYKDEYEVARLWSGRAFKEQIAREFESFDSLEFHLAPPFIARRDPNSGHLLKSRFGPWMMRVFALLARFRRLRGTAFDPFGRTAERRMERRLIEDYLAMLDRIARELDADNHAQALELASLPDQIRGYGHVKEAAVERAMARRLVLEQEFARARARPIAAE